MALEWLLISMLPLAPLALILIPPTAVSVPVMVMSFDSQVLLPSLPSMCTPSGPQMSTLPGLSQHPACTYTLLLLTAANSSFELSSMRPPVGPDAKLGTPFIGHPEQPDWSHIPDAPRAAR